MGEAAPIDATCATPGCRAPRDRGLTLRLLLLLPLLAFALKVFGFRRTYARLGKRSARRVGDGTTRWTAAGKSSSGADAASAPDLARHITDVVVHVNRHVLPYQSRCLLESTALWYLLRRRGFDADLRLGARTLLGPLQGHAWVELDGAVLNDTGDVRDIYETFELPPLGAEPESR